MSFIRQIVSAVSEAGRPGQPTARRDDNLIPWKERGWHFGLSQPMCHKVGVDTGHSVHVEMRRQGDAKPQELQELLESV
jgi:hypothetical protein